MNLSIKVMLKYSDYAKNSYDDLTYHYKGKIYLERVLIILMMHLYFFKKR